MPIIGNCHLHVHCRVHVSLTRAELPCPFLQVFERRLRQYLDAEEPILRFYSSMPGLLARVHIVGGVDTMLPRFRKAVGLDGP